MSRHVVWDWNGTLLADQHVVLHALNLILAEFDAPPTTLEVYQRLYTRPVRVFYERLLDRTVSNAEWHRIDDLFHDAYHAEVISAGLADGAIDALTMVAHDGGTQSLLSMARHDLLEPMVRRQGIHDQFVRVDGLRGPGGGHKAGELVTHLAAMASLIGSDPGRVVLVGDAIDDAVAASHVGAVCVLYDGGSHPRTALEATGLHVASSLVEAIEVAVAIAADPPPGDTR